MVKDPIVLSLLSSLTVRVAGVDRTGASLTPSTIKSRESVSVKSPLPTLPWSLTVAESVSIPEKLTSLW